MQIGRLNDLANNRKDLDINRALRFAFTDRDIQELVLNLNRYKQLFNLGVDYENSIIGYYSAYTEFLYRGQIFDGKTKQAGEPYFFLDTGWLFESFYFRRNKDSIEIGATDLDKLKDNEQIGDPNRLLGLTDDSKEELIGEILPHVRGWLLDQLLKEK